ncbi:LysR family transcriptional regulator [Roseomonas populi]|uniref:LysR family transcriptional regulator n=1 Tax=Roseomonas populi TaxID=3121582 RepID=A0ABT1XBT1_9PROT|nr:LysR family transcriptional regulator [Roseomonas pecuniae]MCR0985596.1 LysR family transcriptional regulator [Roseomonas pecuniae]
MRTGVTERQLAVFRAVMIAGTVSAAAKQLHLSQPAVTGIIRRLEDLLGLPLFERAGGRLVPTVEAGRIFAELQIAHEGFARLMANIRGIAEGRSATFRFGASASVGRDLVPRALVAVLSRHPDLRVECDQPSRDRTADYLLLGEGECVLTLAAVADPGIGTRHLGDGRLVLVVPAGHPLAVGGPVGPAELQGYPLISFPPGPVHGAHIDRLFTEAGLERRTQIQVRSTDAALALTARGLGIALLDSFSARGCEPLGLRALPVKGSPTVPLLLHWCRHRPKSRLAQEFGDAAAALIDLATA